MEKTTFRWQDIPLIFLWRVGSKTINVFDKSTKKEIDCISFGHEQSQTDRKEAKRVIDNYLVQNQYI